MERQRDRRIARLAGRNKVRSTESTPGSPRSHLSVGTSHTGASERHRLISRNDLQHRQPSSTNSGAQLKHNDNHSNSSQYMTPQNGAVNSQRNSHKEEDLIMLKENDDAYEKDSSFMSV